MPYKKLTTYQAVIAQARAFRNLKNFMAANLNKYHITMTEWLLIGCVIDRENSGIRLSELAEALGVELPVVTNLVNKAEADGWIVKCTDTIDKRARLVKATPKGAEQACKIEGELRASTVGWLSGVDNQALNGYLELVSILSDKDIKLNGN